MYGSTPPPPRGFTWLIFCVFITAEALTRKFSYFSLLWLLELGCNGAEKFLKRDWKIWKKAGLVQEKQAKCCGDSVRKSTLHYRWGRFWLGFSTDAFLKSVKKFLDKEVRLIRRSGSLIPHHFTMLGSQIDLFFCNRFPDYPAGRILDNIGVLQKY